ncbi:MAG: BREX system P-loop protein BrxC [Spirochaetota bacterium]|jgi:hypothetical protein
MPITLKEILNKDITRPIDGVIKAGDESHILQEVEEYVITREIDRELRHFVEHYSRSIQDGSRFPFNGVWISGYFGSGKSHLLKMLSLVLSNRRINGTSLKDIFLAKIQDAIFRADFEKIIEHPSTSILFNIEQMAESAKNRSYDPVLFAFWRMFNRIRGYYDESGPLANFERDLDEEGQLAHFKDFYLQKNAIAWEEARPKALLLGRRTFIRTLAAFKDFSEEETSNIIASYEKNFSLTVDGFCREVAAWLKSRPDRRHRINFFVDEVGQFIAGNVNYMLSLQTVTETLGVATGERAWVFVTSQEAIDKIVGDAAQRQSVDFSKIIARFKFRIALSSADVREVIQRRLLEKNERGTELLRDFYHAEKDSMRTVFSFREGGKNIHYRHEEDFVYSYPFPAYQYDLLQEALHGLGEHNAFIGRHVSRGERSMLEMFQDVGKAYKDKELFSIAPFDAMYDGIRSTLDTGLIMAINQAEHNLDNPLAVRILKALLLVKYVRGFRATLENLKVLLTESLDGNSAQFETNLRETLAQLERQTYIRRTGEIYEYLTNDEKDAEEEIQRIAIDNAQYRKFLADQLFGEIIRTSKIRYEQNGEDYAFQKAVDDESPKGQGDLVIRLITPWHPDAGNRNAILTRAMGRKELAVFLPDDASFMEELETYHKTSSWLNMIDANLPKYARIVADKRAHNADRIKSIRERAKELFASAEFAVGDEEIQANGGSAIDRIERAFQDLVRRSYPNLRMIQTHYTQESLRNILYRTAELIDEGTIARTEAETEMLSWIQRKFAASQSVTLALLKEEFSRGAYGWYEWAILCTVALLFVHQEIELSRAAEVLGRDEVFNTLNQNRGHESVSIKPTPKVSAADVERLKKLHFELFHKENDKPTPKECGIEFKTALLELRKTLDEEIHKAPDFTFVDSLRKASQQLEALIKREWHYFLEQYNEYAPDLHILVEETVEPAITFLKGPNVETWKKIDAWLDENHDNLNELDMPDAISAIRAYRASPDLYKTSETKHAKDLWNSLVEKQKHLLEDHRKEAPERIQAQYRKLQEVPEWQTAPEEVRESIRTEFDKLKEMSEKARSFGTIRDIGLTQAQKVYENSLRRLAPPKTSASYSPKVEYATAEERKVPYGKSFLQTEQDVDEYAAALARKWKELVASGKRIQL